MTHCVYIQISINHFTDFLIFVCIFNNFEGMGELHTKGTPVYTNLLTLLYVYVWFY